jgi:hypothetical protein
VPAAKVMTDAVFLCLVVGSPIDGLGQAQLGASNYPEMSKLAMGSARLNADGRLVAKYRKRGDSLQSQRWLGTGFPAGCPATVRVAAGQQVFCAEVRAYTASSRSSPHIFSSAYIIRASGLNKCTTISPASINTQSDPPAPSTWTRLRPASLSFSLRC